MTIRMPARWHFATASATSGRGGSIIPASPRNVRARPTPPAVPPGAPPPSLLRHRKVFSSGPHPGAALEHFSGRTLHEDGPAIPLPVDRGHPFPPGIEGDLAPPRGTSGKRFHADLSFRGGHPHRRPR